MNITPDLSQDALLLQTVLHTVLDGLIVIDAHGTVQNFNAAAVKIFGYQPEEVIGKNVKMLMPEPYQLRARWIPAQLPLHRREKSHRHWPRS